MNLKSGPNPTRQGRPDAYPNSQSMTNRSLTDSKAQKTSPIIPPGVAACIDQRFPSCQPSVPFIMKTNESTLIQTVISSLEQVRSAGDLAEAAHNIKELADLAERVSTVTLFGQLADLLGGDLPDGTNIRFFEATGKENSDFGRYGVGFEVMDGDLKLTRRLLEIFGAGEEDFERAEEGERVLVADHHWNGDMNLRDFADAITVSGEGEFFDVTYTIGDLRAKRAKLEKDLKRAGIPVEKAA